MTVFERGMQISPSRVDTTRCCLPRTPAPRRDARGRRGATRVDPGPRYSSRPTACFDWFRAGETSSVASVGSVPNADPVDRAGQEPLRAFHGRERNPRTRDLRSETAREPQRNRSPAPRT